MKTYNKTRSLLLYWFRGGSTIINALLQHPGISPLPKESWEGSRNCKFLLTNPSKICPYEDAILWGDTNPPFDHFVWRAHMGDVPVKTPKYVKQLGNSGKIIMLVRDGRNQIASQQNFRGKNWDKVDRTSEAYFKEKCQGFKNRADLAIKLSIELKDKFKIIKFEDLIKDPLDTLLEIYSFWNISPDIDGLKFNIKRHMSSQNVQHSSFKTVKNINNRWQSWTEKEKDIFYQIAGPNLKVLGYK